MAAKRPEHYEESKKIKQLAVPTGDGKHNVPRALGTGGIPISLLLVIIVCNDKSLYLSLMITSSYSQ
jgi:hypothetical protein